MNKVTSEKSVKAVVEDNDTPEFVRVAPPAVYADQMCSNFI